MNNWNNKIQVKKGNLGEEIIDNFLIEQNYHVFSPVNNNSHIFDRYALNIIKNEHFYFDVKTKSRLNKWEAQGIDEDKYLYYINVANKFNLFFWIFFIDENSGDIHAANLIKLKDKLFYIPMKKTSKIKIVAWYLKDMNYIGKINDKNVLNELKSYNSRNYTISQIQTIPF